MAKTSHPPRWLAAPRPASSRHLLILIGMLSALAATGGTLGCFLGCGIAVSPDAPATPSDAGIVTAADLADGGVVTFAPVAIGDTERLQISVNDTADTDETLTGATFTGAGASSFQVVTSFPLFVPAGQSVLLQVEFTPVSSGTSSAVLVLQTEAMGPSPIPLAGAGLAADGG